MCVCVKKMCRTSHIKDILCQLCKDDLNLNSF